ncbi:hypothetical protein GZ78_11210 [Endozoicomonas numazuensis]|uniref:Uncharacterized protein n=1 Tax=Endozoicomonas numazuensis TaxID=1137799 RepID=A0A081NI52_9GAMM|nr:hypothetical protein GZ78_11210 [Endozoicomonas numazuensis]
MDSEGDVSIVSVTSISSSNSVARAMGAINPIQREEYFIKLFPNVFLLGFKNAVSIGKAQ